MLEPFRDPALVEGLVAAITREAAPDRTYRLMEFCGGHTHAIFRYGILDRLPPSIRMVHGPGCPVCVLPQSRVRYAVALAELPNTIVCSYGDLLRVPDADGMSLLKARANGADARMVYSTTDALELARKHPDRVVLFIAIGFETTAPATAIALKIAEAERLSNFFVLSNHVLTPPAVQHILEAPDVRQLGKVRIDGFIGPAHVSTVIGSAPFEFFAAEHERPVVIAGFEPVDLLQAVLMLVRQLNEGRAEVENQYLRAVRRDGNPTAKKVVSEVFELRRSFEWRGLGEVPYSGLKLRERFEGFDAELRFPMEIPRRPEPKGCLCPAILRGAAMPHDCKLFGTTCTPDSPIGSCMVSSEGACSAYFTYEGAAPKRSPHRSLRQVD
ncbi:MAG: hydrogenase formation protein HypD [Polyangiaceae bacterium]